MRIIRRQEISETKKVSLPDARDMIDDVRKIIDAIGKRGDEAVSEYSKEFDGRDFFEVKERKKAYQELEEEEIEAIRFAAGNIKNFSLEEKKNLGAFTIDNDYGAFEQRAIPVDKVGCYVPGGYYPLPSSALMSVIPAKVAGVKEIIVCSPKMHPAVVVAADIAGTDRIFSLGGVQAIAAMAFGTKTIPRVDKIVGPGNKYVTVAKKEVFGKVGIDFLAGPSEILIIADDSGNPKKIASDLLAQAEHDPDASADLVTDSKSIAKEVQAEIDRQLEELQTREIAKQALGDIILVKSMDEAVEIANNKAPEHLEIQARTIPQGLRNYGALFIGESSAEVFGDYCSGSNHILPTAGAARFSGGLGVRDFVKFTTIQSLSGQGAAKLSEPCQKLAQLEGLDAHRRAASTRGR